MLCILKTGGRSSNKPPNRSHSLNTLNSMSHITIKISVLERLREADEEQPKRKSYYVKGHFRVIKGKKIYVRGHFRKKK